MSNHREKPPPPKTRFVRAICGGCGYPFDAEVYGDRVAVCCSKQCGGVHQARLQEDRSDGGAPTEEEILARTAAIRATWDERRFGESSPVETPFVPDPCPIRKVVWY